MKLKGICLFISFLFFFVNFVYSGNEPSAIKNEPVKATHYTAEDIRTGERLFHGLIATGTKTIDCASCHNVGHADTLNWNPSAMDLATKYENKDFASFKTAVMQPTGKVMTQIHESLTFTDEQLGQIKAYLSDLAKKGEEPSKPLRTNRILFISLIVLFLLAFADFAFVQKIKYRIIPVGLMLVSAIFITNYVVNAAVAVGRSEHYQPDQPIKFSHKIHAGQNKISCTYCHFNAEQSKFAGIPPANVCTNCHVLIKEGSKSGKFEIDKIYQAIDNNRPIKWVKVHNLPDHVFFSHAQHVVAGKIDCAKCHGDVASMDQIQQVSDLSMGFCIKCHRETSVQLDNKFYGKYEQLHKDLRDGKIDKATVEKIGGTDCMKCHY
jgi:cytochrome c553